MNTLEYKENKLRGSLDFPIEMHIIDAAHPRYVMPCHWHEECELIYIESGEFVYEIDMEEGLASEGDILFVSGEMLHSGIPNNCIYKCIVFSMDFLMKGSSICYSLLSPFSIGSSRVNLRLPSEDNDIHRVVRGLFDCISNMPEGYILQTQGLLYQLFGYIIQKKYYIQHSAASVGSQKRIRQLKNTLAFIESNYSSPLTLEQMAQAAEMSPKYFCYFFHNMTHHTPIDYLNRHRIDVARMRLAAGHHNITELAFECGFNDLSYFIRVFKRYVGTTPKQYIFKHVNIKDVPSQRLNNKLNADILIQQ